MPTYVNVYALDAAEHQVLTTSDQVDGDGFISNAELRALVDPVRLGWYEMRDGVPVWHGETLLLDESGNPK